MKIPEIKSLVCAALLPALLIAVPSWAAKNRNAAVDAASAAAPTDRQQSSRPSLPYNDTRLAVFEFDPNLTYEIKTLDSLYTHIEIAPGDKIRGFYPSDTTRWKYHVAGNKERIFIKPTAPGLFNSVTMVTDRRVYELTFISGKEGDSWYKRVTWHYADERAPSLDSEGMGGGSGMDGVFEDIPAAKTIPGRPGVLPSAVEQEGDDDSVKVDPASMHFSYSIEGNAAFRPVTVFDNGKFTWIRFSPNLQDMPAVFAIDAAGKAEIVDYVPRTGGYIMITKVLPGILLKLKSEEVKITGSGSKKFCMFGC